MFGGHSLDKLEALLSEAREVVPMRDVYQGARSADVIGLRHDVDDNPGSLRTALAIADWEHERGFRSTFYLLHTASYWEDDLFLGDACDHMASLGHEIGIHVNALTVALQDRVDPDWVLHCAISRLRSYGHQVDGFAAHGDQLCHAVHYVNDEQFEECARPEYGAPDRVLRYRGFDLKLQPRPMSDFGLVYDTHRLPHGRYLSDSGGVWNEPFPGEGEGQLHMLWHPDWWAGPFGISRTVEPMEV